ncbi:hypothetical protein L6452_09949 [Arctium lappa]|uniref:Uncharacterized protein n=1 Tax=Arctium lappa TaxID=4217 RepID=A0ACB9DM42_ARCLA|nr:hypothetical protein L6452_09949 [Arctium lappa]
MNIAHSVWPLRTRGLDDLMILYLKLVKSMEEVETPQPKAKYAYLINTIVQDGTDLSLQEPKTSQYSGAEELFGNRRLLNLQGLKISQTHCTFLTKYLCDILH